MMYTSTAFFVVAVLVSHQSFSGATRSDSLIDRGLDIQEKLLHEYIEKMKETEEAAKKIMDDLTQKLQQLADHMKAWTEEKILEGISKANDTIHKIQESLVSSSSNVASCLHVFPEGLLEVTSNISRGALYCVTNKIDEGLQLIGEFHQLVKDISDAVNTTETQAKACNRNIQCFLSVVTVAGKNGVILSSKLAKMATQASTLLSTFQASIETCVTQTVTESLLQTPNIGKKFLTCLKDEAKHSD